MSDPSAPSVRRAQIPDEVRAAAGIINGHRIVDEAINGHLICDCGSRFGTPLDHAGHVARILREAAAPVLLSEYQQRIEAVVEQAEHDLLSAEPRLLNGARMVRMGWVENLVIDLRAALGSTKEEK